MTRLSHCLLDPLCRCSEGFQCRISDSFVCEDTARVIDIALLAEFYIETLLHVLGKHRGKCSLVSTFVCDKLLLPVHLEPSVH